MSVTKWSGLRYNYKDTNWTGLVATSCNCYTVSITFKFYNEINRHQISKYQKGSWWATTDDGSESTLTISDLLSETSFPVWKYKTVIMSVKHFHKCKFKVITIIMSLSTNSTIILNFP